MVVGFNHNFSYKGQTYHVQTEDSGIKNPHIITLLYRGGTILASKKTSYADIIKVDHLEAVVEDLMKSQHREMLRLLKNGDFDELLGLPSDATKTAAKIEAKAPPVAELTLPTPKPVIAASPIVTTPPLPPSTPPAKAIPAKAPVVPSGSYPEKKEGERSSAPPAALTLDDIILSYMVGEDRKK